MMIRKSALLVLSLFILLSVATIWLLRSSWTEQLAENTLQDMFEAKVEIEGLSLDLISLKAKWDTLVIADKDREMFNLIETGPAELDIVGMPLFEKKIIIELAKVDGVSVGGRRKTSGWLEKKKPSKAAPTTTPTSADESAAGGEEQAKTLAESKEDIPSLDLTALTKNINVDGLINRDQMKSVSAVKSTRDNLTQTYQEWDKRLAEQTMVADAKALKARIDKLDLNTKDINKLKKQLDELKQIQKEASRLQKQAKQFKQDASRDWKNTSVQVKDLDELIDKDVDQVRSLAKVADMDLNEVGKVLFGRAVIDQFEEVLGYLRKAKDFVKAEEEPADIYERRQGRDIHFKRTSPALPEFLLAKAEFSGVDREQRYQGTLMGLSSSARVYGKPMHLDMDLSSPGGSWNVSGEFDRTGEISRDLIDIDASQVDLGRIDLQSGKDSGLPQALIPLDSNVSGLFTVIGGRLDGQLSLKSDKVSFDFHEQGSDASSQKLKRDIKATFKDFDSVDVVATLSGTLSSPSINVKSNLDNKISARFKSLLGKKIKGIEDDIRKSVKGEVNKELNAAKKELKDKKSDILGRVNNVTGSTGGVDKRISKLKNELEKKIAGSIKNKGVDELKDSIKNFRF